MQVAELLLWAVAGWCAIGLLGTILSFVRGHRGEARRQACWLIAVAGIYLLTLLAVSTLQKQRTVALGQDQCFGTMCFRVTGVEEGPGLVAGAPDRVIRVKIAVANRGHAPDQRPLIGSYLLDSGGRRWDTLSGLSGNPLSSRIPGGSEIVGEPLFRVAEDARGLGLVLTGGSGEIGRFVIGNSDSLAHKPTIVDLGR